MSPAPGSARRAPASPRPLHPRTLGSGHRCTLALGAGRCLGWKICNHDFQGPSQHHNSLLYFIPTSQFIAFGLTIRVGAVSSCVLAALYWLLYSGRWDAFLAMSPHCLSQCSPLHHRACVSVRICESSDPRRSLLLWSRPRRFHDKTAVTLTSRPKAQPEKPSRQARLGQLQTTTA